MVSWLTPESTLMFAQRAVTLAWNLQITQDSLSIADISQTRVTLPQNKPNTTYFLQCRSLSTLQRALVSGQVSVFPTGKFPTDHVNHLGFAAELACWKLQAVYAVYQLNALLPVN